MLLELRDQTDLARRTLLDLASGIYPTTLEDRGIAAALEEQATRGRRAASPSKQTASTGSRSRPRRPCTSSASRRCRTRQKYARASHVAVRLGREDGHLAFEIRDDGIGFDGSAIAGSGLQNMRDRLSALGGEVEIDRPPARARRCAVACRSERTS